MFDPQRSRVRRLVGLIVEGEGDGEGRCGTMWGMRWDGRGLIDQYDV